MEEASGSMICMRGVIICEENRGIINAFLPEEYKLPDGALRMSDDFITEYQYTRGDAGKRGDAAEMLEEQTEKKGDSNLMIYNGQALIPGTLFYHGFILTGVSRLEVGALIMAIEKWQNDGGIIGGSSRIGHGRLNSRIIVEDSPDFTTAKDVVACVEEYKSHVVKNAEKCVKWLHDTFSEKPKKEKANAKS
jgi:hypothetical protein